MIYKYNDEEYNINGNTIITDDLNTIKKFSKKIYEANKIIKGIFNYKKEYYIVNRKIFLTNDLQIPQIVEIELDNDKILNEYNNESRIIYVDDPIKLHKSDIQKTRGKNLPILLTRHNKDNGINFEILPSDPDSKYFDISYILKSNEILSLFKEDDNHDNLTYIYDSIRNNPDIFFKYDNNESLGILKKIKAISIINKKTIILSINKDNKNDFIIDVKNNVLKEERKDINLLINMKFINGFNEQNNQDRKIEIYLKDNLILMDILFKNKDLFTLKQSYIFVNFK